MGSPSQTPLTQCFLGSARHTEKPQEVTPSWSRGDLQVKNVPALLWVELSPKGYVGILTSGALEGGLPGGRVFTEDPPRRDQVR